MTKSLAALLLAICCLSSSQTADASKLDELKKQRVESVTELEKLKVAGLGHAHPKVKQLETLLQKIELEIENTKELQREIVVLIEGTKSHYLEGHSRHSKSDKALTELLNAGWKIEQIIPAGTTKEIPKNQVDTQHLKAAYVWLSFEG